MPSKRKAIALTLILILFVSVTGLLFLNHLLPDLIEKKGRQIVLQKTPFTRFAAHVLHAGLNGMEIGEITAGDTQNPALSIASASIKYSPSGLFQKRINTIDIHGLTVFLDLRDRKLTMPGLNISNLKNKKPPASVEIKMPLDLEELVVENGNLHFTINGKRLLIPFDLVLKLENSGQQSYYKAVLQIFPRSEKITVSAGINLDGNTGIVKLTAPSLNLEKFAELINTISNMNINGLATVDAFSEIRLRPFEIISAESNIGLQPFYLKFNDFQIKVRKDKLLDKPLLLSMEYKEKLHYSVENIFLTEPIKGILAAVGVFFPTDEEMSGSGDFSISLSDIPSIKMIDPVQVRAVAAFAYDRLTGDWHFDITEGSSTAGQTIRLQYKDNLIELGPPELSVSGKGVDSNGTISFSAAYPKSSVQQNDIKGEAEFSLTGAAVIRSGSENIEEKIQAAGLLKIQKGVVHLHNSDIVMQDINGSIPWHWPVSKQKKTGSITAADIKWQKTSLGSIGSDISLQDATYSLQGNYRSSLLQGLVLDFSGRAGLANGELTANLEMQTKTALFAAEKLGRITPLLAETSLNGKLFLDGSLQYDGKRVQGKVQGKMQNGRLEFTDKKYVFEDLTLSVNFPFLPQIRTDPAQQLRFGKASLGNLSFTDGRIVWELESTDSLFIKSSIFQWAGGNLQVNDARLAPDKDQQFITILCEKLNLIEVLQQFGVENAEGEGTVSGEIPLLLGKRTIDFKDGFLASSSGEGGRIKIAAFDLLSAGIPKNSPQFGQIDFAAEALKNFQYDKVTLLLNSEGENLVMQMQMDGKPVQSLPFAYDSKTGLLQRADDTKQGIMQPIRLDVNFRLPLNRFLGYSGKIQDILDKMQ